MAPSSRIFIASDAPDSAFDGFKTLQSTIGGRGTSDFSQAASLAGRASFSSFASAASSGASDFSQVARAVSYFSISPGRGIVGSLSSRLLKKA